MWKMAITGELGKTYLGVGDKSSRQDKKDEMQSISCAEEGEHSLERHSGASVTPRDHTVPGGFQTQSLAGRAWRAWKKMGQRRKAMGKLFLALKRADIAWNSSRVPASLHATKRYREGSRRRVLPGGRRELGELRVGVGERFEGLPKRLGGQPSLGNLPVANAPSRDHVTSGGS
jgi:hypothetical protein